VRHGATSSAPAVRESAVTAIRRYLSMATHRLSLVVPALFDKKTRNSAVGDYSATKCHLWSPLFV
jgi:hypothetical protein